MKKIQKTQVQASFDCENGELKIKDTGLIEIIKEQIEGRIFITLYIGKSFVQRTELFSNQRLTDIDWVKNLVDLAS